MIELIKSIKALINKIEPQRKTLIITNVIHMMNI
jgi:hypothetical protein